MKTNKLNQKNITDTVITVLGMAAGVAAGGAVGRIVDVNLPNQNEIGKVGILGAGLAGGTYVKGNSTVGKALKNIAIGVAAKQAYDLISDAIKPMITVKAAEDRNILDNVVYGAIGLGCPSCEENAFMAAPIVHFPTSDVRVLEDPNWNAPADQEESAVVLDASAMA